VLAKGRLGVSTFFNRGNAKFFISFLKGTISFNNASGISCVGFFINSSNHFLDHADSLSTTLAIFHKTAGSHNNLPTCLHIKAHNKNFPIHSGVVKSH
jgi:hypothetical protein